MRHILLVASLVGCNPTPGEEEPWPWEGPPLTIRTVDENGDAVAVDRVVYYDAVTAGPPEDLPLASCAEGEPPCSEWVVDELLPVGHAAGERWRDGDPGDGCIYFASAYTPVIAPPDPAEKPQLVHLVLPSDDTWCGTAVNQDRLPALHDDDVRYVPDPTGPLTVETLDLDGNPLPAAGSFWYHPPESAEYDGEHALTCADALCTTWVAEDAPVDTPIYVNATYRGPLHPEAGVLWSDFNATPITLDGSGQTVELPMDADLEAAY